MSKKIFVQFEINDEFDTPLTAINPDMQFYLESNYIKNTKCDYYILVENIGGQNKQQYCDCTDYMTPDFSVDVCNERISDILNTVCKEHKIFYCIGDLNIDFFKYDVHKPIRQF